MHKRASRNALSASKFFELICINLFGNPVPLQNTHIILHKIVSHPVNRYATNIPTNSQERVSPLLSKKVQTTIIRNLFPINEELCSKGYKHYKRGRSLLCPHPVRHCHRVLSPPGVYLRSTEIEQTIMLQLPLRTGLFCVSVRTRTIGR